MEDYKEQDFGDRQLCAVTLRIAALDETVRGWVSIHRATSPVLASCNVGGSARPRIFEVLSEEAYGAALHGPLQAPAP